jgi:flagellar hook assembly protein FlgD
MNSWVEINNNIRTTTQKLGGFILVEDNTLKQGHRAIADVDCQPRIFSPRGTGFATTTTISFKLPVASKITIKVYNLAGRLVRTVRDHEFMNANINAVEWDGRDYNNEICPSDLYLVTIDDGKQVKSKTVMILDKSND